MKKTEKEKKKTRAEEKEGEPPKKSKKEKRVNRGINWLFLTLAFLVFPQCFSDRTYSVLRGQDKR